MEWTDQVVIRKRDKHNGCVKIISTGNMADSDENLNLSMYLEPCTESITIEEFQKLGKERLDVLRALERIKEKHAHKPRELAEAYKEQIAPLNKLFTNGLLAANLPKARRDDRISHFILRLAYCQSVEMSEWFLRMETELFRQRFQLEQYKDIMAFLKANNITPEEVSMEEKLAIKDELAQALTLTTPLLGSVEKAHIYKVDCWEVTELFAHYRLYLKQGWAYFKHEDLPALVVPRFRQNIGASLAHGRRNIGFLQEEDRLIPLMKQIVSGGVAYRKEFRDPNSEDISLDMLDELARESFPLCMRNIHFHLRREHHLRHHARQQYGLFLKGIGLSMEGALEFFRSEFTQRMAGEKFSKEYAYNIRHIYGREGSRIDKKPLSCQSIILGTAPPSHPLDCHGCPFRHTEPKELGKRLAGMGFRGDQIEDIVGMTKMNRPDKACTKYFEVVHKLPELEELITHPNQYYALSRKARRGELLPRTSAAIESNMEMGEEEAEN